VDGRGGLGFLKKGLLLNKLGHDGVKETRKNLIVKGFMGLEET